MSNEERASVMGQQEIVTLLVSHQELTHRYDALTRKHDQLQQQLDWLTRQIFGTKSERHVAPDGGLQLTLGQMPTADAAPAATVAVPAHQRRRMSATETDDGDMRFDDAVPVERIVLGLTFPLISGTSTNRSARRPPASWPNGPAATSCWSTCGRCSSAGSRPRRSPARSCARRRRRRFWSAASRT